MEEARQPWAEPPRDAAATSPRDPSTAAADAAPHAPHPALATAAQAAAREFLASPERAVHVPPAPPPAAASHHLNPTPPPAPPAPPAHASATLATAAQAAARSMSAAPAPAATGSNAIAITDSVVRELRRQQDAARKLLDQDVAPAHHRDAPTDAPTDGAVALHGGDAVDSDPASDSDDDDAMDASTPPSPSSGPPVPPTFAVTGAPLDIDAAWAAHSRTPMDASMDGVAAAREAWVCCDEPGCGKWRRVPSAVAHGVGDSDSWRCADSRDARFAGCHLPQELDDDEIDRRVNAAAAAEREALLAASRAEAERLKREKKRRLDREYRERKKARLAAERRAARVAAGLPPDSPPRPPKKEKPPPKPKPPPRPAPPPPPPPPPPRFYPLAAVMCVAEACGKWRRVPRRVADQLGPRDRWVCAFNTAAPPEERQCAHPQEWADDDAVREWTREQRRLEEDARAAGAPVDGDPDAEPTKTSAVSGGGGGFGAVGAVGAVGASAEDDEAARRRREEAGIRDDLPRGSVSGYAAEAMTAEDEEAHEDPTRAEGTPRTIPPPRARGQPHAAVPVLCGGVPGVFLARRAMFRCMCDEDLENCRAASGDGDGVVLTTTAFEKHCGMEKSKNWRNSVSVVCSDHPRPVKIGIWLGEVGVDVARGKGGGAAAGGSSNKSGGGGGGADADASKRKAGKPVDDRWQPARPGPLDALPLRNVMAALEALLDRCWPESPEEGRRAVARAGAVCKAWLCAAQTVVKTRGMEKWRPEKSPEPEVKTEETDARAEDDGDAAAMDVDAIKTEEQPERATAKKDESPPADRLPNGERAPEGGYRAPEGADGAPEGADGAPEGAERAPEDGGLTEEELAAEEKRRARRERDRERRRKEGYVERKFEVDHTATRAQLAAIEDYVPRGDPDEVARERTVTLAPDQPTAASAAAAKTAAAAAAAASPPPPHIATKHPGEDAVDRRVRVFWPEENAFFTGIVAAYNSKTGKHTINYDDGDVESVTLTKERMEWLEPDGAAMPPPGGGAVVVHPNGDISDPNKPPGWWPVVARWPTVDGKQSRRKVMGSQVHEQETYGVDYVTARDVVACFRSVLPEYDDDELWAISDQLMMQVNASYGPMAPDCAATQSLALAAEDCAEKMERGRGARATASAKALWRLAAEARSAPEMFAVHRKGFGVVCKDPAGVKAGDLVVDFLGEMYPPWAWMAKQDAIKTAQKLRGMKECGPPEFYNMQLERPPGDAEGFSILFVDAMHYNNYAARLSHSCDPNVEVSLRAIDGKYCINFYAKKDVRPGEELCYNYHSCTDSMKEVEAAFCLCGAKRCRASYLAFVGEQGNNHVLRRCHRLVERQAALLAAGDATGPPSDDAVAAMAEVGLKVGRGLLRDAPPWLTHFVGHVALFMRRELARLPRDILAEHRATTAKEVKKANGKWIPPPFGLGDAEIEALSVRENRLQSMAICLSKVRYLLGRGSERAPFADAPPPMTPLSERDVAVRFFGTGRDSMLQNLIACMAPHARHGEDALAHAAFVSEAEQVAREVCQGVGVDGEGAAKDDEGAEAENEGGANEAEGADGGAASRWKSEASRLPRRSTREGLLWLRDRLASMPPTRGARHDVAAELVHMHAHTRRYWINSVDPAHAALRADPIEVRENEVNSYGIGAEGASEKIVQSVERTYKPGTTAGSLLMWYKQDIGDPGQWVQSNRKGVITLPDLSCAYSPRPEISVARATPRERETWLAHLATTPDQPWPMNSGPWGVSNAQRVHGSPMLDAFVDAHADGWGTTRGGEPDGEGAPKVDAAVLAWLLDRKSFGA